MRAHYCPTQGWILPGIDMDVIRSLPLCILLLLSAGISRADAETMPFSSFTAHYRGEANGMSVKNLGTRTLKSLGQDQFQLEYNAEAMIYSLKERSTFVWENGIPKPLAYDSTRGTFLKKRENHIQFNWPSGNGSFTHKKKKGSFKLLEGMQDPLTSTLLLALRLQDGNRSIEFMEAKDNDQEIRTFTLLGKPTIKTALGDVKTYHLQRLHDDKKRHTELWLHHDYPFIPVKVKQDDDGDRFLLELTQFSID